MLRAFPHGEDHGDVAGGDTTALMQGLGRPVGFNADARSPHTDGVASAMRSINSATGEIENRAQQQLPEGADGPPEPQHDFLRLVREAEDQSLLYVAQVNRKAWSQSYRALHNEHYVGSKYTRPDWRGRSKLFVPHTRAAMRKDNAAVAASMFNNIDAISCQPGNDADPRQRGAAAVMQELVNYRTATHSGKAAIPWFLISMGARQDSVATGVCCSKQYWKQKHRKVREEKVLVADEESGVYAEKTRDVFALDLDRPDIALIPPENYVIDPAALWTNPAQTAAYVILKWPMTVEEIKAKQDAPFGKWKDVPEDMLRTAVESGKWDMAAIRRAREQGLDRLDETQTGTHFHVVWVYEVFLRVDGEDWTFYSLSDQAFLTDPKPVREVYPEQFGERPIVIGFGSLESHRIFPMAPVESWQPLQLEINDIRNLQLDATKQNVMPISKVRRGRQIDLDQVKRRSSGTSILVNEPDDVTWETPPQVPQSVVEMNRELSLELDDLAGQQNYGSVETNNALGKTLGGLKLAAGAANAVQEYDVRLWLETWASPVLNQIVRLEQYYESDPIVLGLAGQKAQLFEKYGINKIDDDLMQQDVSVHVSVGLGAGDPQQRLAKFETAANIIAPILQQSPEFMSGKREINIEAIIEEVFGACGYKDGGSRFFTENPQPRANPMQDLQTAMVQARIDKDRKTGQAAFFTGLSNLAKVALGKRELEADVIDRILSRQVEAQGMGADHGYRQNEQLLSAMDHGHRHGLAIAQHRHDVASDVMGAAQSANDADMQAQQQAAKAGGGGAGMGSPPPSAVPGPGAVPPGPPSAPPPSPMGAGNPAAGSGGFPPQNGPGGQSPDLLAMLQNGGVKFTRGPDGRINGIASGTQDTASPYPLPATTPVIKTRQAAQQQQPVAQPQADPNSERIAQLEDMIRQMHDAHTEALSQMREQSAKPRTRKVVRDANNRIVQIVEE